MLTKNSKTKIIYIPFVVHFYTLQPYTIHVFEKKDRSLFGESRKMPEIIPEIKIYNFCNSKSNSNSYPNSMFRDSQELVTRVRIPVRIGVGIRVGIRVRIRVGIRLAI